jgi:hypothetical protein
VGEVGRGDHGAGDGGDLGLAHVGEQQQAELGVLASAGDRLDVHPRDGRPGSYPVSGDEHDEPGAQISPTGARLHTTTVWVLAVDGG